MLVAFGKPQTQRVMAEEQREENYLELEKAEWVRIIIDRRWCRRSTRAYIIYYTHTHT